MKKNGFTLVELMVVIVAIGILAAVAMPKFQQAADKTKAAEAPLTLAAISGGEEAYRIINSKYLALNTANPTTDKANWEILGLKFPDIRYFNYSVGSITEGSISETNPLDDVAPTFTATATLIRSLSRAQKDETITVNSVGEKTASPELKRLVPSYFEGQSD